MKKWDDIEQELKELNSSLDGASKKMPYYIPKGYFQDTDRRILNRITAQKQAGYTVPKNYFDKLPDTMLSKVKKQAVEKRRNISWGNFRLTAAAIILISLSIGTYQMAKNATTVAAVDKLNLLSDDVVLAYVENHIDEFDITTIEESSLPINNSNNRSINLIEDNAITDYLNDTGW